jgi:hypothetical protein
MGELALPFALAVTDACAADVRTGPHVLSLLLILVKENPQRKSLKAPVLQINLPLTNRAMLGVKLGGWISPCIQTGPQGPATKIWLDHDMSSAIRGPGSGRDAEDPQDPRSQGVIQEGEDAKNPFGGPNAANWAGTDACSGAPPQQPSQRGAEGEQEAQAPPNPAHFVRTGSYVSPRHLGFGFYVLGFRV